MHIVHQKMPLLRFPKTFKHTHKIKIGNSLKRVDSDCFFCVLDFTENDTEDSRTQTEKQPESTRSSDFCFFSVFQSYRKT